MPPSNQSTPLTEILDSIDVPESAYEKAETRYQDLGNWFGRPDARCAQFEPHIHPQGSFRLGTIVRPLDENGEYDLDIACRLTSGISKATHTQKNLKDLVGADLRDYRTARGIKASPEEKHRCWRLQYADVLRFHMDVVPTIPETTLRKLHLREALIKAGVDTDLVELLSKSLGAITDDRRQSFTVISDDWLPSDPEGFAKWFETRMRLAKGLVERAVLDAKAATIDDLPAHRWRSPLQRCVQLLKRHRDVMFADDEDAKPPSIILTTLAGRAYQGEADVENALAQILATMGDWVRPVWPRIPNPVNPPEDFADRWLDPASAHLGLETKFWRWLQAAQRDFRDFAPGTRRGLIVESARSKFGVALRPTNSLGSLVQSAAAPAGLGFPKQGIIPKKPAGFA